VVLDAFWKERPEQARQVRTWLTRPELLDRLRHARSFVTGEPDREELDLTISRLAPPATQR